MVMAVTPHAPAPEGVQLTPQQIRNRKLRNIAIGLSVGLLVVLFYVITIVKVGPAVLHPDG